MKQIATRRNSKSVAFRRNCLALFMGIAITSSVSAKAPAQTTTYAIPPGDLVQVVNEISRYSGLQIVYDIESLRGLKSGAVSGTLTLQQALDKALKGTGLTWEKVSPTTVTIKAKASVPAAPVQATKPPSDAVTEVPAQKPQDVTTLPEILVKGSRSLNVDIPRTQDDIQPYVVFEREDLDLSQATNIEEFLTTRLPMNQAKGTMSRNTPEGDGGNRSSFNLRGLGTNQTLILINGRRAPGVSTLRTGDLGQPDLNGIPLSAVDRIEVLPTTASGIYGGGATGGVINVILRKDYIGGEVRLRYDNSFDSDSSRGGIEFSAGFPLEGGRTSVMISGSYTDGSDLQVRDRDFAERGRELMRKNDPERFLGFYVLGTQTNVFGSGALTLDDGTPVGASYGTVPAGYTGGDGGGGLLAGAGAVNIQIPDTIAGGLQSLSAVPTTKNFTLSLRREFGASVDGYLDYGIYRNEGKNKWAGLGYTFNLDGSAPGNPFQESVRVAVPFYDETLTRNSLAVSETERLNAGFIFKLPGNWSADVDFNRSVSTNDLKQEPSTLDMYAVGQAMESGALNVFRDLTQFPLDLTPYTTDSLRHYGPGDGKLAEYAIRAGGPIFELPAGEVRLTAQLSSRSEKADEVISDTVTQFVGDLAEYSYTSYRYYPSRHQDVRSLYVETTAPLIAPFQDVPYVNSLEIQASFRRDEYTTESVSPGLWIELESPASPIPAYSLFTSKTSSNDFTLGFMYRPAADLAFRASFGTGFLPPSLAQVAGEQSEAQFFVTDPKRGNVFGITQPLTFSIGGSAAVNPERSKSFSAGLVYTPDFVPELRLSADYTRIKKEDEITSLTIQQIINLEDSLPGRVVRGANLPDDPAGYAGVITAIDMTLFNLASSKMEAWDFQGEYTRKLQNGGELQLFGVATLQTTMEGQAIPDSPIIDRVGYSNGPLRWRGNLGMVWKTGPWTTTFNAQWYDDYKVYNSYDSVADQNALTKQQGSSRVDSQMYADISTRYSFSSGLLEGMWISAGVRNVFGASPPILATTDSRGGYSTYGDPRGRVYVLSLQKSF